MSQTEALSESTPFSLKLIWTAYCANVHDAVHIAEERRAAGGARVILKPLPSRTAIATGWTVEVQTAISEPPPQEELNREQARIELWIGRWSGVRFLGWDIRQEYGARPSESNTLTTHILSPNRSEQGGIDA